MKKITINDCSLIDEPSSVSGSIFFTNNVKDVEINGLTITNTANEGDTAIRMRVTGTVEINDLTVTGYQTEINNGIGNGDVITFANVTELRSNEGTTEQTYALAGYYEADDGGGSEVFWDENSTEADDGGMVFQVDGVATGRWKRADVGFINVKWFGAKGDGVYYEETVDIFNQCFDWVSENIAYVPGTTSRKIYVQQGTYILKNAFKQMQNHLHNGLELFGDGAEVSELKFRDDLSGSMGDNDYRMLRWASTQEIGMEDIYIHDIRFNGNRWEHNQDTALLLLYKSGSHPTSQNILVENVHFLNNEGSGCSIRTDNTTVRNK